MTFKAYKNGEVYRKRVQLDCSDDECIVEQSHKSEVDINNIVKRHGMDLIQQTANMQSLVYDDLPNNDFFESMNILNRAQASFDSMPSELRKEFDNSPAKFLDFIHNPDNADRMVELGLATREPEPQPINVRVIPDENAGDNNAGDNTEAAGDSGSA